LVIEKKVQQNLSGPQLVGHTTLSTDICLNNNCWQNLQSLFKAWQHTMCITNTD